MQQPKRLIIVGGGTAGWMTAIAFASFYDPQQLSITLIDSPHHQAIGVGEATIPAFKTFNALVGIDDQLLMRHTHATFKLGIEFNDWGAKGESYMHPFGEHGVALDNLAFFHYWQRLNASGLGGPLGDYAMCKVAAKNNRFTYASENPNSPLSGLAHAYHFDATAYAALLKKLSKQRSVNEYSATIANIEKHPNGAIRALRCSDGAIIEGDFFIDCTGFKGLLINQLAGTQYQDWSQWLPCNRAVTVPSAPLDQLPPYTTATAKRAGWQWKIPLQHRCGNGYVFSSAFESIENATIELLNTVDTPIGEPRLLKFLPGVRRNMWTQNCVAIGLSSGFIEPLESTSIHFIQRAVLLLIDLFPSCEATCAAQATEFNRQMSLLYDSVRDFILLHYRLNQRSSEEFWRYFKSIDLPDSLAHKIDLYQSCGRIYQAKGDMFSEQAWLAVLVGQGAKPQQLHPLSLQRPLGLVEQQLNSVRQVIHRAADSMPTHKAFIQRLLAR